MDLTAAAAGLIILWPIFVVFTVLLVLDDGFPVLFRQERMGRDGRPFTILKFRTMTRSPGLAITVGADPRITRVGGVLRRLKLDELPQLVNVLVGDMSLVGPRPELPSYVEAHPALFAPVRSLRPGITDPGSMAYRNEASLLASSDDPERTYIEEILPDKLRLSADYAQTATLLSDLRIVLRTVVGEG